MHANRQERLRSLSTVHQQQQRQQRRRRRREHQHQRTVAGFQHAVALAVLEREPAGGLTKRIQSLDEAAEMTLLIPLDGVPTSSGATQPYNPIIQRCWVVLMLATTTSTRQTNHDSRRATRSACTYMVITGTTSPNDRPK